MSDDKKDSPTILDFLDSPEDYQKIVRSLVCKVSELEERQDEHDRAMRPLRWIFSKLSAGLGTAIAGAVTLYLMGWTPFK